MEDQDAGNVPFKLFPFSNLRMGSRVSSAKVLPRGRFIHMLRFPTVGEKLCHELAYIIES